MTDLLEEIKKNYKQMKCKHDYGRARLLPIYPEYYYQECKKCGKWKHIFN